METSAHPGAVATGGLSAALSRGRAARLAWTQDGTLLTPEAYAAARGISPSVLPELEARGELFSLAIEGACWYPSELLKLSPDESSAVCRVLAGDDAASQLVFVMRTHGALAGEARRIPTTQNTVRGGGSVAASRHSSSPISDRQRARPSSDRKSTRLNSSH